MTFTRIEYDDPANRELVRKYAINGVPYVLMLDANGQVARRRGGNLNPSIYRADVIAALGAR